MSTAASRVENFGAPSFLVFVLFKSFVCPPNQREVSLQVSPNFFTVCKNTKSFHSVSCYELGMDENLKFEEVVVTTFSAGSRRSGVLEITEDTGVNECHTTTILLPTAMKDGSVHQEDCQQR